MKYKDASCTVKERAADLLDRMTLREKIGQLIQPFGWQAYERSVDGDIRLTEQFVASMREGGVGSLYGALRADPWTGVTLETGLSPREGAEAVNLIQQYAVEHTRLGIPILFGEECSHGHMAIGATVFPVPLAMASSWNTELYREVCRTIAVETRAQGGAATYSPVLDVVRDPRWGRTEETFGEDPYLISEMGVAAVQGLQGEGIKSDSSIMATLKHFAGYGASEGGRNAAPVHIGRRELMEKDLLPFRKAVRAGAMLLMTAYNEIDGVPCTSNRELLTTVLRGQWGFDGFVITDCGAINMLHSGHHTAETEQEAAAQALLAGVDMEMSGDSFGKHLEQAVQDGQLSEDAIDEAVIRVLRVKFELGLFERPYVDPGRAAEVIGREEHLRLAREMAREGIVLLKNKQALPLSEASGKLAVIGPNADNAYNQLGDYTSPQRREGIVTALDGIRQRAAGANEVLYAPGCRIKDPSKEGFAHALQCAKEADTVIAVVGGSSARDFGEGTIDLKTGAAVITDRSGLSDMDCGEGFDRAELGLSGVQLELLQELHALGKTLIVVYINGRPIIEPWVDEHADAVVEAWYPGQQGGHAIADVLFGDYNPSGRLALSIPKHVGQLPISYSAKRTKGKRYVEMDLAPRYSFGYGLSYTTFRYSGLKLSKSSMSPEESCTVTVEVSNTGGRAGHEVVQLYVSDVYSSVARPAQELKGFRKIYLKPGETVPVSFEITNEELQFVGANYQWIVEPGLFVIEVGGRADQCLKAELYVEIDNQEQIKE
ncbi:glycoside hydrolase family 3 C-terminal domain-containing protein [Paenibacillus sp. J5C_2022]|uniref:glycoside hydrolase family 3 N-terminal domain-containing protein n=1 Tax=Paenibacillus sp. J5C2022 TaxID=2977129 RepID=UPI0021CE6F16|nr:glycoside hydrolase family 3 N-terminal domain-containing protein [Paenibacillus sp. J5C2022]MCU6713028.1 glycoside hydrolase family 3 C-terminal domain-containing protein [Paenibacillus sp. J5C2022]